MITTGRLWSKIVPYAMAKALYGTITSTTWSARNVTARDYWLKEIQINLKTMTIYDIKYKTRETEPYYFTRKTMRFFGQTLRDFRVKKMVDGRYRISAPVRSRFSKQIVSESVRYFNPVTCQLEHQWRRKSSWWMRANCWFRLQMPRCRLNRQI